MFPFPVKTVFLLRFSRKRREFLLDIFRTFWFTVIYTSVPWTFIFFCSSSKFLDGLLKIKTFYHITYSLIASMSIWLLWELKRYKSRSLIQHWAQDSDYYLQSSAGEGHGKLLQYSCLENPMDRGPWQITVHSITQSWTWLKGLSMHIPLILLFYFSP